MSITSKNLVLGPTDQKPGLNTWYSTLIEERKIDNLKPNEVIVQLSHVGFNHRDKWIRQGLYPGVKSGVTMGSDGAGKVVASAKGESDDLIGKRVFLNPSRGWHENIKASEEKFVILGGCDGAEPGTFATHVKVDRDYLHLSPDHLSDEQVAAFPLAGVTAWRATFVKAGVQKGDNVLITGIGGGVALQALQYAVHAGANVYVTSGKQDKIDRALKLGAKGGVNYKNEDWPKQLKELLPSSHPFLDAVVDSSGGDIVNNVYQICVPGSSIAIYGMTADPKVTLRMPHCVQNIEVKGSTMGSKKELKDATEFISKHKIVPIIDYPIVNGLDNADEGFDRLKNSTQFGKVVINVAATDASKL